MQNKHRIWLQHNNEINAAMIKNDLGMQAKKCIEKDLIHFRNNI